MHGEGDLNRHIGATPPVRVTLEDELLQAVDRAADRLNLSRSAFTRDALRTALARLELQIREQQHREGYLRQPVTPGEFGGWEFARFPVKWS